MFFQAMVNDSAVQVAVITTIGLILVAIIGVYTAKLTSGARIDAENSAENASKSAQFAKDYAAILEMKNARIELLSTEVDLIKENHKECQKRLKELEVRIEEHEEQRRAAYLIEREHHEEIESLHLEIESLKKK